MKKFTKLLGIVLIIALVMSMGIMAWAEDGDDETETPTASITITKDKTYEGENQAYTYKAYKIFDANYDTLSSTWTQTNKDAEAEFTYTPADAPVAYFMATGNPWISTIQGLSTYFTVTEVVGGYSVVATDAYTTAANAKTVAEALQAALVATDDSKVTPTGDYAPVDITAGGSAVAVDPGYYLIVGDANANLALVTTDVTLVEKNEYTKLLKEFNDETTKSDFAAQDDEDTSANNTVQVGDTVSYILTVVIPTGANQEMVVTDSFTSGLAPVMDGTVVKTTISGLTNATPTVSGITAATSDANAFFTVTLSAADVIANAGKTFTIVYEAVVTADAWHQTEVNTGVVDYGNVYKTNPDSVDSETFNLTIQKKAESSDGDSLKGAQFKLYRTDNNFDPALDKVAVTLVALTDADLTAASITKAVDTVYYRVADADDTTTTDTIDMTNAYDAVIYGLDGDSTYYVEETVAPTGYNKLEGYTDVQMNKANQVQPIVNNSGTVLPSTGGIGTTIFYVVGSILVVAAGVLLITKKRMSREG